MRNLNKPNRYNVASIQAQQTLGGDVMQADENGQYVTWRDYKWLLESYAFVQDQWKDLDAEVERLRKAGDAMARIIAPPTHGTGEWDGEWDAWNAAKEGKQS